MRVLGIDPGTNICGWGIAESGPPRASHIGHGTINLKGELPRRLADLFVALDAVIIEYSPDVVAVEGVFARINPRSALILGHARGVALLCAARAGLEVMEYPPATVKKSVVGNGRAEKKQVQTMVGAILGLSSPLVSDAADALAVALCHIHHEPCRAQLKLKGMKISGTRKGNTG